MTAKAPIVSNTDYTLGNVSQSNINTPHSTLKGPEAQRYFEIWESKIEAKGWERRLFVQYRWLSYFADASIIILDIGSSGSISQWQIDCPAMAAYNYEWAIQVHTMLQERGRDAVTRLVVFSHTSLFWVQETIGIHYNIGPAVFRDISLLELASYDFNDFAFLYGHLCPGYTMKCSPQHLNFDANWVGKVIKQDQGKNIGPSNIGGAPK